MKQLTVEDVEYLAFRLAREMLSYDEPIPEFCTRFPSILESCLVVPFMIFNQKELYPTLVSKASILLYLMIKNHPFQNGNKRIALATLFLFLYRNNKWLRVQPKDLYRFTIMIAESEAKKKGKMVELIEGFINMFMVDAGGISTNS